MKRTLHVRKSVPDGVVLCELGRVPLYLYCRKVLLKYVSRISELPSDRLVKKACTHASFVNTHWWQKLSLWLNQHRFEGVLAEGPFSLANAEEHLGNKWVHGICQSSATKVSFFMDNIFFDSNVMASCLRNIRPSASLFSLIKFRLGGHSLRVETDRWLRPKSPREQRVCRHCSMQAVEDEQHFVFDCPFYSIIRVNTFRCLAQTTNNGTLGSFLNRTPTTLVLLHTTYTCAFKPGCLMSHHWLHTPDYKL